MQIFWIRHAPINHGGCYTGQREISARLPLAPVRMLEAFPKDARWYSSALQRALETAQWLMPHYGADPALLQPDAALNEQHFGAWEGRSYEAVWQECAAQHDWSQPAALCPPDGESFVALCKRVDGWLERLLRDASTEAVMVVAHAGVIRAGLRHALGVAPAQALAVHLDYGSVTQTRYHATGGAMLGYVNRLCWVEEGE